MLGQNLTSLFKNAITYSGTVPIGNTPVQQNLTNALPPVHSLSDTINIEQDHLTVLLLSP
jgi:hypothetical protein